MTERVLLVGDRVLVTDPSSEAVMVGTLTRLPSAINKRFCEVDIDAGDDTIKNAIAMIEDIRLLDTPDLQNPSAVREWLDG